MFNNNIGFSSCFEEAFREPEPILEQLKNSLHWTNETAVSDLMKANLQSFIFHPSSNSELNREFIATIRNQDTSQGFIDLKFRINDEGKIVRESGEQQYATIEELEKELELVLGDISVADYFQGLKLPEWNRFPYNYSFSRAQLSKLVESNPYMQDPEISFVLRASKNPELRNEFYATGISKNNDILEFQLKIQPDGSIVSHKHDPVTGRLSEKQTYNNVQDAISSLYKFFDSIHVTDNQDLSVQVDDYLKKHNYEKILEEEKLFDNLLNNLKRKIRREKGKTIYIADFPEIRCSERLLEIFRTGSNIKIDYEKTRSGRYSSHYFYLDEDEFDAFKDTIKTLGGSVTVDEITITINWNKDELPTYIIPPLAVNFNRVMITNGDMLTLKNNGEEFEVSREVIIEHSVMIKDLIDIVDEPVSSIPIKWNFNKETMEAYINYINNGTEAITGREASLDLYELLDCAHYFNTESLINHTINLISSVSTVEDISRIRQSVLKHDNDQLHKIYLHFEKKIVNELFSIDASNLCPKQKVSEEYYGEIEKTIDYLRARRQDDDAVRDEEIEKVISSPSESPSPSPLYLEKLREMKKLRYWTKTIDRAEIIAKIDEHGFILRRSTSSEDDRVFVVTWKVKGNSPYTKLMNQRFCFAHYNLIFPHYKLIYEGNNKRIYHGINELIDDFKNKTRR